MGYQSTLPPLGADEQAVILDVIRRAEQLDHLEQERVSERDTPPQEWGEGFCFPPHTHITRIKLS